MVRLTRLRIDRFRNVKPGTELRFGPTFNVLLGKNATGKSTLLDLIAAVTNDDLSAYAKEDAGFDLTWWLEKDENELELRAERTPAKPSVLSDRVREEKEFDDVWTIALRIRGADVGRIEVVGTQGSWSTPGGPVESFAVRTGLADGRASVRTLFFLSNKPIVHSMIDWFVHTLSLEGVGRFDEALGALGAITRSSLELTRDEHSGPNGLFGAWLPMGFILALYGSKEPDPIVVSFDKLGSLSKIPTLLGFAGAELYPRILKRSKDGDKVTTSYQGLDCLFRRADGSQVSHELLSFGQKRLFAFLWYLALRDEFPVVADELLNGLHHEWIEACFERLRDRQSFLATQHPLLLDHIPIESAEAVRTTFIRCSTESGPGGREQLAWRNFTEEEAERFFIAYQTGIQQVSEVLRSEGLW